MCSCYLITINHQNKETDFRVQLCGILANLRQEKGKRGKKRRRTGGRKNSSAYSFTWEGMPRGQPQCFTVKLKRSKRSATSRVLHADLGCWAPAVPSTATESRSLPHSGSSFLGQRPLHSLQHPEWEDMHQLSSTGASKPLPHHCHVQAPTPRGGEVTAQTLWQRSVSSSTLWHRGQTQQQERSHCFSDTMLRK